MGGYGNNNNFPKQAASVAEWLAAIGMVRRAAHARPTAGTAPLAARGKNKSFFCLSSRAQGQYTEAFAAAGVEVAQLRNLSNSEIKQLVPVEGHKRRLVSRARPREASSRLSPSHLAPISSLTLARPGVCVPGSCWH